MAGKSRRPTAFNLSFLDIMACGFGAVILLFLILKHDVVNLNAEPNLQAEVARLDEDIRDGEAEKVKLRNSLQQLDDELAQAEGLSRRVIAELKDSLERSVQSDPENEIALLREQVKKLEQETANLRQTSHDKDLRTFIGDGDRQYLTGLKLGGRRVLILLDSSASMLADDLVNVIRRRNMSDASKRASAKWQRAAHTAEWLLARLPAQSQFQIMTFNTSASTTSGNNGWLNAGDKNAVNEAVSGMNKVVPGGGTSLANAFRAARALSPDNIFLITDGLPTQGATRPSGNTVSASQRVKFFQEAVTLLPRVPVNVILFPMEGDPAAAGLYWQLGLASGGSFLSPATDWP